MTKVKILFLLALLSISGCSPKPILIEERTPPVKAGESELAYFGFAVVDCGWDDPNDSETKTNYVDEIAGFANIAQLCVYSPDEFVGDRLELFNRSGVKVILSIEGILFEHAKSVFSSSGEKVFLRADAEVRWTEFVALNKDALTPENIAVFYIVDEPAWNGVSLEEFSQALNIVKASFPNIPVMTIEASGAIDKIMVPENLDWIGFDNYDSVDPANDALWLADLETLRAARTRPDQKIVIIASTQWLPYYQEDAGIHPKDMEAIIASYYQVAGTEQDIIALIGYLWAGGLDDPAQLGARSLPENVQDAFKKIGKEIIEE